MNLKLLSYFLIGLFLASTASHAMKRQREDDLENQKSPVKRIKVEETAELSELQWYSYAEFLTFIYKIKSFSLKQKFEYLCAHVLTANKTQEGGDIYQAWISFPLGPDFIMSVQVDFINEAYDLFISNSDKDETDYYKPGLEIFSSHFSFKPGYECVKNNSKAVVYDGFFVEPFINELLFALPPAFIPLSERLSADEFYKFLESLKEKDLIEKMIALNNGVLIGASNAPLLIELKENVVLMLEVNLRHYSSNCLAEKNFLTKESGIVPKSLYYYFLTVSVLNGVKQGVFENAAAVLVFPLDAGYGEPHLPSEINSICRAENLSGTEILSFVKHILSVIKPNIIYLNDASSIKIENTSYEDDKLYLRIIRPLASAKTFYEEYAHFTVFECCKYYNHMGISISQSKENYKQSVRFLRNFKISEFKSILTESALNKIKNILAKYDENSNLKDVLAHLFELYKKQQSNNLLDIYFVLINDYSLNDTRKSRVFGDHIQVLWDACVWESKAYKK